MAKLRVHNFTMSLDGYAAGPSQDTEHPLGVGGDSLHPWIFATRTGRAMVGQEGGSDGVDDAFVRAGEEGIGATIMGRNMFGPVRGPWPDESWQGWWGENPPFHHPVFVLTHHSRPSLEMEGGTVFHFVDAGLDEVLRMAVDAANGLDVRLGGGVSTVRAYLAAGLVDEMHVAIPPVLLRGGERLFDGPIPDDYRCAPLVAGDGVAHARIARA